MTKKYAANTKVSIEKSQTEIKNMLRNYGANRFGVIEDATAGYIMFEYAGMMIQMEVPFPNKDEFKKTETGRNRIASAIEEEFNKAIKRRWRSLFLSIKAKLVAIDDGISTLEKEFLSFIKMPDGRSLSDHIVPRLNELVNNGKMPQILITGKTS